MSRPDCRRVLFPVGMYEAVQRREGAPVQPARLTATAHRDAARIFEAKPGIWCWAVTFRRRGKAYYKSFYDVRRGGSKWALAAAIV